ncbi:hypothetical protein KI387_025439 [Taxus chinensis]|uniref:Glycosyltransferase n=1 Tax=Taxus chinensis TaxID=29808 RepID=A0AA38FU56_TAXCH|nr:hypothetical protein KI387_025439 [Taxus chinensis]
MERRRSGRPVIVMYAGCGWSHLIPFLHFARILCNDHHFSVTFITHESIIPGKKEYIQWVADSCSHGAFTVGHANSTTGRNVAYFLKSLHDQRCRVGAYVVDSMWAMSPQLASYHLHLASGSMGMRMRIPTYIFYRHSASFLCLALLKEKLYQGELGASRIPGLSSIASTDLPPALLADRFPAHQIPRASALSGMHGVIINSWEELESAQLAALRSERAMPPVYPIGPLMPSPSLLPEPLVEGVAHFLDRQAARTVVFVSLGPDFLSAEQITELAVGLEACGHPFLWALKPSSSSLQSMSGQAQSYSLYSQQLPEGFVTRTQNRGLVISWPPPQGYILSRPCIGGFVSHCGWNSTVQSILNRVPIITWPVFDNEQKLNALVLLREMKAAIEARKGADGLVSGKEVERCCRVLMGLQGISVSTRMIILSIRARNGAMAAGGSSLQAIHSLASAIDSNNSHPR